jgi:hypothetical protein
MSKVSYKTTWQEAQRFLLDHGDFVNDTELQSKRLIIENFIIYFYKFF